MASKAGYPVVVLGSICMNIFVKVATCIKELAVINMFVPVRFLESKIDGDDEVTGLNLGTLSLALVVHNIS